MNISLKPYPLFLVFLLGASTLLTGCGTASAYPDEFWAVGNWKFTKASNVAYGPSGDAKIVLHFTRRYNDQYEINGTTRYAFDTLSCRFTIPANSICPIPSCVVTDTTDGTFTGVAGISGGVLTVKPVWLNKEFSREHVTTSCDGGTTLLAENNTAFLTQSLQAENGMIDSEWTIDLNNTVFIDDVPANTFSESATASKTFSTHVSNMVNGEALFGLYRHLPE